MSNALHSSVAQYDGFDTIGEVDVGRLKQQAIADEEYYDNLVAWMRVHKPLLSDSTFNQIVNDPPLLRATVTGWVALGKTPPPKPASEHVSLYYLPSRRDLRPVKRRVWPMWFGLGLAVASVVWFILVGGDLIVDFYS